MQPVLPEPLTALGELAHNLRWSWHEETKELFRAIDPEKWGTTRHDPVALLAQVSAERLQSLAGDRKYVRNLERAKADFDEYCNADRWYQQYAAQHPAPKAIAYFSAEFGIAQVLPIYSGGLGILAGDHLKGASDLGVPIIGVGLCYRHGYFRQSLNAEGWQEEHYPLLDSSDMPIRPLLETDGTQVVIEVPLRGQVLRAAVWIADVGRVPLVLMDTDIDANPEELRRITDKLYGGNEYHRLSQEVLLGIGGVRAVREFCRLTGHAAPDVYHCNEGHAGFLGLERIREYIAAGRDFDTALELTRAGNVFTTHTPVPAGIDRFPRDLVVEQFRDFGDLPLERILALGAEDYEGGDPGRFNMAVMGLRLGARSNGVSELHGEVSREMFQGLWPAFDTTEVPIGSVTNGVHHRTWIHPELLELLEWPTDDVDTVIDGYDWSALERVDSNTIWSLKRQMRGDLVRMARERLRETCRRRGMSADWVEDALDPSILTFGFARRAASYKRLTLMLADPDRLKRLLLDPERPIQIVIAGKAHPADQIGKSLIQRMVRFADAEDVRHRIVFLPDYDISMARRLYPGCDVWINNPLRPQEACGTSGMKAALNGAANLSVKDGWWDEWYDPAWGWAIPSSEDTHDPAQRDAAEARALYELIEGEIVPKFYDHDSAGIPQGWVQMIRDTLSGLGPKVLASRMVRDYVTDLYAPASVSAAALEPAGAAEDLGAWKRRVRAAWPQVDVHHVEANVTGVVEVNATISFVAEIGLGELSTDDVEVQIVSGQVDDLDQLHELEITAMVPQGPGQNGAQRYAVDKAATQTGAVGYTLRVVPRNDLLVDSTELGVATLAPAN